MFLEGEKNTNERSSARSRRLFLTQLRYRLILILQTLLIFMKVGSTQQKRKRSKSTAGGICCQIAKSRLENALWRRFFQQKNNLAKISPAVLNWSKESDVLLIGYKLPLTRLLDRYSTTEEQKILEMYLRVLRRHPSSSARTSSGQR